MSRMEFCEICKIQFSSEVVAEAHYSGKKHAKKLKEASEEGETVV